jgi:hypothetical protein
MASIAFALARVKHDLPALFTPELVRQACRAAGYDRWRERLLPPWVTLQLFALQILAGNVACRAVRHLGDLTFTTQAYCKARAAVPLELLGYLAAALIHEPELQNAFGQPGAMKPGCGFPVMHVLWLFDSASGLIVDFITGPWRTHDMAQASSLHALMKPGDILVGDRAFGSFAHLALLLESGLHGVFRLHQRKIVSFNSGRKPRPKRHPKRHRGLPTSRLVRRIGLRDQIAEYYKPKQRPKWMIREEYDRLPASIQVRELEYQVKQDGYRSRRVTLVSTLLDETKYEASELAELYRSRWRIEINLRHLKATMKMDVLHCKTLDGVSRELWMYLMVYNQVRLIMLEAAASQQVAPERISFIDALEALARHGPGRVAEITLMVNPYRPGRSEPRVIKRRKDRYSYMTRPREQLRRELGLTPCHHFL